MKQGQVATEHLFLIGALVFVSLILFYYAFQQISETRNITKAEDAVSHLAEKVNELSTLTAGTRDTVWVEIPSSALDIRLSGKMISLVLLLGNKEQYILTKETFADVVGVINLTVGLQQIYVAKINDTAVKLGLDPLLFEAIPSCLTDEEVLNYNPPITLFGFDFQDSSTVYTQDTPLPTTYQQDVQTLQVLSIEIYNILSTTHGELQVRTPPSFVSNNVCIHIHETTYPCACAPSGG